MNIIQNAVYLPEDDRYIVSAHTHDYQSFTVYGKEGFIDGGLDYLKSGGDGMVWTNPFFLTTDNSIEEIKEMLLWGTRGKDGKQPLTYKLLKDCASDHLREIQRTCPDCSVYHRLVLELLIGKQPPMQFIPDEMLITHSKIPSKIRSDEYNEWVESTGSPWKKDIYKTTDTIPWDNAKSFQEVIKRFSQTHKDNTVSDE